MIGRKVWWVMIGVVVAIAETSVVMMSGVEKKLSFGGNAC